MSLLYKAHKSNFQKHDNIRTMTLTDGAYDEFIQAWKMAGLNIRSEHKNVIPWRHYGGGSKEYSQSFKNVMPNGIQTFSELGRAIKKERGQLFIFELAGEGEFIRTMDSDGGVALTLTDQRKLYMDPNGDKNKNIEIATGEMLAASPWVKTDKYRKTKMGNKFFDLAVGRPLDGWSLSNNYQEHYSPELQYIVISKMWKRLSSGANLFIELPIKTKNEIIKWQTKLMMSGITLVHGVNPIFEGSEHNIFTVRIDKPNGNQNIILPSM